MVKTGPKIRWENYSNPLKNRCDCVLYSSWQGLRSPVSPIHRTLNWCFFHSLFMYHIYWTATFLSNTKVFIWLHLNSIWQTFDSKIESFSLAGSASSADVTAVLSPFIHWFLIVSMPFSNLANTWTCLKTNSVSIAGGDLMKVYELRKKKMIWIEMKN